MQKLLFTFLYYLFLFIFVLTIFYPLKPEFFGQIGPGTYKCFNENLLRRMR